MAENDGSTSVHVAGNRLQNVSTFKQIITPELLLLKRVKACIGWAVHGIVMEFIDGSTRAGFVNNAPSLYDDNHIRKRHGTNWVDIEEGDYVKAVSGFQLSRRCFLCHTLRLEMASGKIIEFASTHDPWKGEAFRHELPEAALLHYISFRAGKCIGVTAAESHLHLPLRSAKHVERHLHFQPLLANFRTIQLCIQRLESNLVQAGERPLGRDIWSKILFEYLKGSDLQAYAESTLGQLKECQRLQNLEQNQQQQQREAIAQKEAEKDHNFSNHAHRSEQPHRLRTSIA